MLIDYKKNIWIVWIPYFWWQKKCKMEHSKLKNESLNFFDSFSPPTKHPIEQKLRWKNNDNLIQNNNTLKLP